LLLRLVINIVRKDWFEYRKMILLLTGGMFIPLVVFGRSSDFSQGMITGILIAASYGYASFCFMAERQQGTLQLLISLPARPFDLVVAKYASLYSMILFTVNIPGIFLGDLHTLFLMNCVVVFLATISMAGTVISDKPWAPMIPIWIGLVFFLPFQKALEKFYPDGLGVYLFITSHTTLFASLALILAPALALGSAVYFKRKFAELA
jgi:hypothetical protein